MYQSFLKRIIDFAGAFLLLILFSPLMLLLIILLFVFQKGKVLFVQNRPGLHGRIFKLYKFKTMSDSADEEEDTQRITSVGFLLRKTSLDELPQLINILKGEMSFIGPRPLLEEYLSLYNAKQRKRHQVLPGITGLAQVNGRNAITWKEKFELDVYYVENVSLLMDVKIFLKTLKIISLRENIYSSEGKVPEKFKGNH